MTDQYSKLAGQLFDSRLKEAMLLAGLGDTWEKLPDLSDETETNCVLFGEDVLEHAYDRKFQGRVHNALMVTNPGTPFSSVGILVEEGLAMEWDSAVTPIPGHEWLAFQKWTSLSPLRGGHFGFVRMDEFTMFMVDATNAHRDWARYIPRQALHLHYGIPRANVKTVALLHPTEAKHED